MEPFPSATEPDEGYSEHPLSADNNAFALPRGLQSPTELSSWLAPRLSSLSVAHKTQLAMAILGDLPTTVIADIVLKQLNPRLYIDFVEYLPTEICLKIFGYLDPVSVIHVARTFLLEGWRALPAEIDAAEERMNAGLSNTGIIHPQRLRSSEYGHAHKKRAISDPTPQDIAQSDAMDIDNDRMDADDTEMAGTSLFGGPAVNGSTSSSKSTASVAQHLGHLMMESPSPMPESAGTTTPDSRADIKGKGKARANDDGTQQAPAPVTSLSLPSLPTSSLWTYDARDMRYKINWQWLYAMRRRLEYNWETGKFTNFQFPHPNHPEEGHGECVYSLQFNSEYLVSGSRDQTIRIWNMQTRRLVRQPLRGHVGSVLCLQFESDPEDDLIVSGSSDSNVILWKFSTGQPIQWLRKAHTESVLNVKFDKRILVTCSKDKTIKIFNRTPLRAGDVGYGHINGVSPVPINIRHPDHEDFALSLLPIKPPYTQIGCLEGHGAAVNAVQICGNEIVSASGDRHIKVWDWPQQTCRRTFLGHNKGIACVQYDGRRIVSGSSDNEVKVFDRETGLEVASLRAHTNLVRTVQAGFADLPYSAEEDRQTAREIDQEYFRAVESGRLGDTHNARGKSLNAGSRRPEDITAYGAKLPPGGGGGPYGRIVSGSYDQTIIIWRRDKEGVWRSAHTLRQEDAAAAALRQSAATRAPSLSSGGPQPMVMRATPARPLPPASAPPTIQQTPNAIHVEHPIHATLTAQTNTSYTRMIDLTVPQGPVALQSALLNFPTILTYHSHMQTAIDREPNPANRSQLRQVVATALVRAQVAQNRIRESAADQSMSMTAQQSAQSSSSSSARSITPTAQHTLGGSGPPSSAAPPSAASSSTAVPPPTTQQSSSSRLSAMLQGRSRSRNQASGSRSAVAAPGSTVPSSSSSMATTSSTSAGPPTVASGTPQHATALQQAQAQAQQQATAGTSSTQPVMTVAAALSAAAPAPAPAQHHPHITPADQNPRVFKLQFDARRIICCSQTSTIVGWDFYNGDPELEEACRFFGPVE
ncbi:WD domain-containing protein [Apiospora phragmitis]|uniref:WD domain-containing protein n=1 Tax=Apiospora phragmitis TaxID=2905665 RepID=A0ABR1WUE2_9PEZI